MCSTQPGIQSATTGDNQQDDTSVSVVTKTATVTLSSSEGTQRERERVSPSQSRYEILKYGDDSDDDRMIICEDKDGGAIGTLAFIVLLQVRSPL